MFPEHFVRKVSSYPTLWPTMSLGLYNQSFFHSASTAKCMRVFCLTLTWLSRGWGPFPVIILLIKGLHYNATVVREMEKPCEEAARDLSGEEPSSGSLPGGTKADPSWWRGCSPLPVPYHVSMPVSSAVETGVSCKCRYRASFTLCRVSVMRAFPSSVQPWWAMRVLLG